MPENGTLLTDVMDAGMTLDGPAVPIQAMEEENMVLFMLYISTQVPYPVMETEAPVVTEPNTTSSAARPRRRRTASWCCSAGSSRPTSCWRSR